MTEEWKKIIIRYHYIVVCILMGLLVLIYTLCTRQGAPSGYATVVVLLCFMFSVLFFLVGIIGEYIAVLFEELKDRPIYIIEEKSTNTI